MPRVIQPVKVGKKKYYAVFSTISMDFLTPFYKSVRELKKNHPEYKSLKVANLFGRGGIKGSVKGNRLTVRMKVYRVSTK
jgi:hypothetical protein